MLTPSWWTTMQDCNNGEVVPNKFTYSEGSWKVSKTYQLTLAVTIIDFIKAFDLINRKGIPEAVVNAISVLYNNSRSAVTVAENISDSFDVYTIY